MNRANRGNKCEECGIEEWNSKPITFQVDHVNGNRRDNRHTNLKILCPNCHSQTETFGVKNISEDGYDRMIEGSKKGILNYFPYFSFRLRIPFFDPSIILSYPSGEIFFTLKVSV